MTSYSGFGIDFVWTGREPDLNDVSIFAQERSRPELDASPRRAASTPKLAPAWYRLLTLFHASAARLLLGALGRLAKRRVE
jgi:hypothetical protein